MDMYGGKMMGIGVYWEKDADDGVPGKRKWGR